MKCHYSKGDDGCRVLIPGCMAVAISYDIGKCTCKTSKPSNEERLSKLEEEVMQLKKLVAKLSGAT